MLADLEKLAEFDEERDGADKRPDAPALSRAGLTAANLDGIGRSLKPDGWLSLSLTPIKSEPVFEYQAREQEYIPFRNASVGQQATALLKTLLNQPGPPLIIDQPEEDLDNPVMLEIVERVWEAKQKRQLVFVSHNANLVVNGDAELVAWCDYRTTGDQSRGTIAGEGAIDVDIVRNAIKQIMEGGEAAFNLRRENTVFERWQAPELPTQMQDNRATRYTTLPLVAYSDCTHPSSSSNRNTTMRREISVPSTVPTTRSSSF